MNRSASRGGSALFEGRELARLNPAWRSFIRHCEEMQHGEIERLKIQDGLPVLAETSRKRVKFM